MASSPVKSINCVFHFGDINVSRTKLFEEALCAASRGRVLYILYEELNELPQLSQEINSLNKHYLKMISFLYVNSLDSLIESISTLPNWQNIPTTIILDDLSTYCNKDSMQNACGLVALLINTAETCSAALNSNVDLYISVCKNSLGENYCNLLQEMYSTKHC